MTLPPAPSVPLCSAQNCKGQGFFIGADGKRYCVHHYATGNWKGET